MQQEMIHIDPQGDLILVVPYRQLSGLYPIRLRVDTRTLQRSSPYFRTLLDSRSFAEGVSLKEAHEEIRRHRGHEPFEAPDTALPEMQLLSCEYLPPDSASRASIQAFFGMLHGHGIPDEHCNTQFLVSLATMADAFDSLPVIADGGLGGKLSKRMNSKSRSKSVNGDSEQRIRQRLLVGWLFDEPSWMTTASRQLVLRGSKLWEDGSGMDMMDGMDLSWRLPDGIEGELQHRRRRILNTFQSMQSYLLQQYTSRQRQCKLGYDTSSQCDSFQLGEMIRFFTRIGSLGLQGLMTETEAVPGFPGDIEQLVTRLRQCPSYQIDRNHAHCGIRARLLKILEVLQHWLEHDVGLCRHCWRHQRVSQSWKVQGDVDGWMVGPDKGLKRPSAAAGRLCEVQHQAARELFTAKVHDWSTVE
ncbi:MAG: hypothetical protein M1817_001148 [Caeruleum heppii]|nr:MAG: hypothetical protein M1817_001148 [Caeruleum heppii]